MKHTDFKNRERSSEQDDEISWMKGYSQALTDRLKAKKVK